MVSDGREANIRISRSGPKELVDITAAPRGKEGDNPEGVHMRYLFDFQDHKVFMVSLRAGANTCSWMRYVSAEAPVEFDPITGSAAMLSKPPKGAVKALGAETINGIPTKVQEFVAPGESKIKIWLGEKGNVIVKLEGVGPDGKPLMRMEIKQLNYGKPADSLFSQPPNCTIQAQGEWSSTELNAGGETSFEVQGAGATAGPQTAKENAPKAPEGKQRKVYTNDDMSTSQPTSADAAAGAETEPSAGTVSQEARPTQANSRVTEVHLHLVPDNYTGSCPVHVQLVSEITTDGPGTVWYLLDLWGGSPSREGTVSFSAAGTKTVTVEETINKTMSPSDEAELYAVMEDQQGNHAKVNVGDGWMGAGIMGRHITCTGQASPAQ